MVKDLGEIKGRSGTFKTLAVMSQLVLRAMKDPRLIDFARNLVRFTNDPLERAAFLYEYIKAFPYVHDPQGIELIKTPQKILKDKIGDCDEYAVALAALYSALGYKTAFVVAGTDPEHFKHVYVAVKVGNKWYAADPTYKGGYFGWKQNIYKHEEVYPVTGSLDIKELSGLEFDIKEFLKGISNKAMNLLGKGENVVNKAGEYITYAKGVVRDLPNYPTYAKNAAYVQAKKEETKNWLQDPKTQTVLFIAFLIMLFALTGRKR